MLHKSFKFKDHISVMESTLELYYRTAKEEEGIDGPTAVKVREIKRSLRQYRRNSEGKKRETPTRRSHHLFYDSVDEDVDKSYPYDILAWDGGSGLTDQDITGMKELVEQHKNATSGVEVKRLERAIIDKMMKNIVEQTENEKKGKEPTIDDDLEDIEEDWEDENSDWENEDDDIEYIEIWEKTEDEAFELYDQAECELCFNYCYFKDTDQQ